MSSMELDAVEAEQSLTTTTELYVVQNQNKNLRPIKLAKSPSRIRSKYRSNDATADIPQNSGRVLIRRSSYKPVNNLTRMPSLKFKNSLVRKSSGGTQLNKHKSSSSSSSPNCLKETGCSSEKRCQIQCCSSESSSCSTSDSTPNSTHKSARLSRTKSKARVIRKQSEISEFSDLGVQRATCSSALRRTKSPPEVKDVHAEGSESEGPSATMPCPFTYCSLHGHRQANVPPLKRLISIRRRLLKTQRGATLATRSTVKVKKSSKIKEDGMNQMASNGYDEVHGTTSPVKVHVETCSKEDEDYYDLSDDSGKLLREALEESLQEPSDFSTAEEHVLVSPTSPVDLCQAGCFEPASAVTDADLKEDKCAASCGNECIDFNQNSSRSKSVPQFVESDDYPNVELCDLVVESTSDNESHDKNCASSSEPPDGQTIAIEQNGGSLVTDKVGSLELDKNESVECSMQAKNHKYITLWKLMYKHAVKGNPEVGETPVPLHGEDKEDQVEGTTGKLITNNPSFAEPDEHIVLKDHTGGDQTLELCQKNAIDLVQEAFDKILLPEVQDCLYDDQSVTSGISSDQDGLRPRNDEGEENRTIWYGDSSDDRIIPNTEAAQLVAESRNVPKEKAAEDKFEQNTPKRWSSLKKFILLKRFVKAIEKVRNLSHQKPHFLPLDPDPEAEKIDLRQLALQHTKSADEWMIDYALQKVISKLSPPQQRRVSLLVEAFETVLPFPETVHPRPKAVGSTEADVQPSNGLSYNTDGTIVDCDSGNSTKFVLGCMSCPQENSSKCTDKFIDVKLDKQPSLAKSSVLKESSSEDWSTKTEVDIPAFGATDDDQQETPSIKTGNEEDTILTITNDTEFASVFSSESKGPQFSIETCLKQEEDGTTGYEVLKNETVQEISTEHISVSSLDRVCMNPDEESSNEETGKSNSNCNGAESDLSKDMVVYLAPVTMTEIEGLNGGGANANPACFQRSPLPEESHSESNANATHVTLLEKQNYTRLWYFVYKHMVSSIAEKDGDGPPDEADGEQGTDTKTLPQEEMDPKLSLMNQHAVNKKNELCRIETVKLVEKAIDEILLPESQDESEDDLANTRDLFPDQKASESNINMEGNSFATFSNVAIDSFRESKKAGEDPEEILLTSDIAAFKDDEKEVLMVEEKPKQKMSKNWRNLKKMVLLNRFVKALEKGKKSNSRGPKFLPLKPDPEAEKVNLKHQNMDERKNAEEWMLDYALQKAVAKLTPARSRKVALLVEAFETVIPNKGIPNPFKPEVIR